MTVVAWDGRTLAADKRMTNCGLSMTVTKLRRAESGDAMAVCGDYDTGEMLFAWYNSGAEADEYPNTGRDNDDWTRLIVARADGFRFTHCIVDPQEPGRA